MSDYSNLIQKVVSGGQFTLRVSTNSHSLLNVNHVLGGIVLPFSVVMGRLPPDTSMIGCR